ncbi:MAG: hypothetical protein ACD_21C00016G0003 [uncultured bacterium]|nr:MAG: hypothetical protein ACD_21C00016G0003 [uncultured bacterium]
MLIEASCFTSPDNKTWLSRSYWHPLDAACLFNGVNPNSFGQIEFQYDRLNTKVIARYIQFLNFEEDKYYGIKEGGICRANLFFTHIQEEADAIETWKVPPHPLILVNKYIQTIVAAPKIVVPKMMLRFAKENFLYLYQRRNDTEERKKYWNDYWYNNVADPFLQVIAEKESTLLKKDELALPETDKTLNKECAAKQDNKEDKEKNEKVKIILEESARAREKRIRNRGHEIYKDGEEKYPHKKITKEDVARQIMQEEAALYELISKEQPLKKQPVLGTYLKELRKTAY